MIFESGEIGDSWLAAASFGGSLATSVPRTFEGKKEREAFPSFSPELGTRDAPIPSMSEPTEWDIRPSLGSRRSALFPLIDLPQPPRAGKKSDTLHFPEKDDEVKKNLLDNQRGPRRLLLDSFGGRAGFLSPAERGVRRRYTFLLLGRRKKCAVSWEIEAGSTFPCWEETQVCSVGHFFPQLLTPRGSVCLLFESRGL